MKSLKIAFFILTMILVGTLTLRGQSATDAFYMTKGNLCIVGDYSHESWKNYWEGTHKRETHSVGTFKTNAVYLMLGLGITDNLLFTVALPYVWTSSTEFYNTGQHGLQDLSGGLKYKAFEKTFLGGKISLHPSVSASIPVTNYVPDDMPYSIGNQSKTITGYVIVDYMSDKNYYTTMHWGYVRRDNIKIDASSYYFNEKLYYTNEMRVPDMIVYGAELGYDVERFRAEAWINVQISQEGNDIRRNDRPYPFNRMSFTKAGATGKYNFKKIPNFSLRASFGYTLNGRNVGQSLSYLAGVQYILKCY